MPLAFEIHFKDGDPITLNRLIEKEYNEVIVEIPRGKEVDFVLFDPGDRVIKTVSFSKSKEEWSAQALRAPHMIDRYHALENLSIFPLAEKEQVLLQAWKQETFHLTRGEILRQLLEGDPMQYHEIVEAALRDEDPLVRRAVLIHTRLVPESLRSYYEKLLTDFSFINVEKSLELLCRSYPERTWEYLEVTSTEVGWRGLNIRMKWLELAIGQGQLAHLKELSDYSSSAFEFETRINAFNLLKRLDHIDSTTASNLVDGYFYWNYKVSGAAAEVLSYFYVQNRGRQFIDQAIQVSPMAATRKDALTAILNKR
jgi:hypothetical protein